MFCRRCWIDFRAGEHPPVECSGPCGRRFHHRCVLVPGEVARVLRGQDSGGLEWYCHNCRQLYRLQLYFEVATDCTIRGISYL
ncbi:uncharacterized protein Dana_GF27962 [Drosophila ananassae]|uniref:PHD-type domain-containing protein n=1 Tax=Drosophila ananassae TaxID=7217 RepID=A0A0P9BUG2_DROAN|nr:uncharacterized protein Dana_GF27962 [Drosophila ananassae]